MNSNVFICSQLLIHFLIFIFFRQISPECAEELWPLHLAINYRFAIGSSIFFLLPLLRPNFLQKKKMESEDDMHDANDAESLDDFYSGETAADSDDLDAADYEFIDNDSDDSDDLTSHRYQVFFFSFFIHLS